MSKHYLNESLKLFQEWRTHKKGKTRITRVLNWMPLAKMSHKKETVNAEHSRAKGKQNYALGEAPGVMDF